MNELILSTFTGIGLLDSGFEKEGFCVVQAREKILGGDIRNFTPIPGKFTGVIGGSPCQDFSTLRRTEPTGEGVELIQHFGRIVLESDCNWFLLENVPSVPDLVIPGYHVQRFDLSPNNLGYSQSRLRHFQFGSKSGFILDIKRKKFKGQKQACLTATEGNRKDRRLFSDFCELQGLPRDFDLPDLNKIAKYRAVGNGVHLGVSQAIAKAIKNVLNSNNPNTVNNTKTCACGCGRILKGKQVSSTPACRKRLQMRRKKQKCVSVTIPGNV